MLPRRLNRRIWLLGAGKPLSRGFVVTRGKGYYHSLFHVTRGHAQLIH
jgi:hypothetical protein